MTPSMSRRTFIQTSTAAAVGVQAASIPLGASDNPTKPVRVGVVGTGRRGRSLLSTLLRMEQLSFPALCDINQANLELAKKMVVDAGHPEPDGYYRNDYSYEKLMARDDLDAVIIATYWQWHTPMAVCAMKHGKYAGVEVPAALSLEECWDLVNTHERTGTPCMMLENWSFRRDNLAVLNMIREDLFGEIVHCHCAHSHDCVDHWFFDRKGNMQWGGEFLLKYNRDQYPTHSLGPVLSWMELGTGDYFDTITSTATDSKGINDYFIRTFGKDHPNARRDYQQGDIVTSVVRTKKGKSLVINYDMQLPRPYDNRWTVQGTRGIYNEQRNALYITDRSPDYHKWEPFPPYQDKFDHAWWKHLRASGGHGGTDTLELLRFLDAVRNRSQTPLDVYDSVLMSCIIPLSGLSISRGSGPIKCPDFTRGKWKTRKLTFAV